MMNEQDPTYNPDYTDLIQKFVESYKVDQQPIRVNFRELVPQITKTERYSHLIHSYPAKLLCHIPYLFLQTDYFCPKGGLVLDPFCGTGTVLLEALLAGKNAYGADANPLARLITKAKTTYISQRSLHATLRTIVNEAKLATNAPIPEVNNIELWFNKRVSQELANIIFQINKIGSKSQRAFFKICFSNLIKKVSFADPRISVPVRLNPHRFENNPLEFEKVTNKLQSLNEVDVFAKFEQICNDNIDRIGLLKGVNNTACVIAKDARKLTQKTNSSKLLESNSVDLILTSPPYAGAQKYIRSSSLNLAWLGLASKDEQKKLDAQNIGRETYKKCEITRPNTGILEADIVLNKLYDAGNTERAHIVANYINQMKLAIAESYRVLKEGGHYIMIIGNNTVCGQEFNTQHYLTQYMESIGFNIVFKLIDDIKSYGLMTKRNKTASTISCEWVLVLKK